MSAAPESKGEGDADVIRRLAANPANASLVELLKAGMPSGTPSGGASAARSSSPLARPREASGSPPLPRIPSTVGEGTSDVPVAVSPSPTKDSDLATLAKLVSAAAKWSPSPLEVPVRDLLERFRFRYKIAGAAHSMTSTFFGRLHLILSGISLIVSLVGGIAEKFMTEYQFEKAGLVTSFCFAIIGGITAVNNVFGFSANSEKHVQLRDEYSRIVNLIDTTLAVDPVTETGPEVYREVLARIQELDLNLKKRSIQIPKYIQDKILALRPWDAENDAALPPVIRAVDLF